MDKDIENQSESDQQESIMSVDTEIEDSIDTAELQVVKQKSNGGLSLFISLLALAGSGFLLYKDYSTESESKTSDDGIRIDNLMNQNEALDVELNALKAVIDNQKTQINAAESRLNDLTTQNTNDPITAQATPYDNSGNEAALEALNKQLLDYQDSIEQLTQRLNQQVSQQQNQTTQQTIMPKVDQYNSKATIETLMITELLLANNQILQAKSGLTSYLSTANIRPSIRSQVNKIINQLDQVEMPDVKSLTASLIQVKAAINKLKLPTQITTQEESSWYDRFISVKKISDDSSAIGNSAFLEILKSQLNNHILQAELALVMQNQGSWKAQLEAAKNQLISQMPGQADLIDQLNQLIDEVIRPDTPEDMDIQSIISDLKGFL